MRFLPLLLFISILWGRPSTGAPPPAPPVPQKAIAAVSRMAKIPEPLDIRDWHQLSRDYYALVLNPNTELDGKRLVFFEEQRPGFKMPSYLASEPRDEAVTCLAAIIGATLAGHDPKDLNGIDWLSASEAWFDAKLGIYRTYRGQKNPVVHSGIYGYWSATLGIILAAQHPDNPTLKKHLASSIDAFETIATGLGCPDRPDFDSLGFNFETKQSGGREEPMNRLGNSPSIAWPLVIGASLDPPRREHRIACARAALQWHIDHPGRYELTHIMAPLAAARLNAEHAGSLDLDAILDIWFGSQRTAGKPSTWFITAGAKAKGMTLDGLDGARWKADGSEFHTFAMSTLHGPAWLVPVARYDQRYARDIARYALHVANNARLFQGHGLGWDHQDHFDWKAKHDPRNLLFYEALSTSEWSSERKFRPYATGDPIRLGWGADKVSRDGYIAEKKRWFAESNHNLSLYSGAAIGFLGGICTTTKSPGVLLWDCLKTDWLHPPAFPTKLVYNPYPTVKEVTLDLGDQNADLYDTITHSFIKRDVRGATTISIPADTALVLVQTPPGQVPRLVGNQLLINDKVIDYRP